MTFPTSLTEEELELKAMFETLKRVKKLVQTVKVVPATTAKGDGKLVKQPRKRNLEEIAVSTEEAKRLVKAGGMTIKKTEEKQTFKRSKQLDRKLKEGDRDTSCVKYQPFNQSGYGGDYTDEPARNSKQQRVPSLYDSFISGGGEPVGGAGYGGEARVQRGTTIYIRGYDLMEEPLRQTFMAYGTIMRVHIEERRRSAFVEYMTNEEADRAIKEMNGNMLGGITLRVTMARRQNYVLRQGEESLNSESRNRQSAPESWASIASGRGGTSTEGLGSRTKDDGRDVVSYDDADEY